MTIDFFQIIQVVFYGIIEGITEWLPISSTGHMILAEEFLNFNKEIFTKDFMEMFRVVIQLGAILAVVVIYFNKLNPFNPKKTSLQKKNTYSLWLKVIVGCLPAAVIGLAFQDKIDEYFYNPATVAITLIVYGVLFIIVEMRNKNKKAKIDKLGDLTYKTALIIGLFQVLSLIPGTSRSGATILGAILIGTSRLVAAEYTFFLAIPVMFGASFLKIVKYGFGYSADQLIAMGIGLAVAFIVSIIAIKFLMSYIKKHDFKVFGWYRIALGIIVILYFLIKAM